MKLSVIIVNFNTKQLLQDCLSSLYEKLWRNSTEVWVVDNSSSDGSVEMVRKKFPRVRLVITKENLGFAKANNQALKKAQADYYLLLNSDTKVSSGSLDNLVDFMERKGYGIGSCHLVGQDGTFQPNAGDLPFGLAVIFWLFGWDDILGQISEKLPSFHRHFRSYYQNDREVGWVSGSVMIISDRVIRKIGLLDEDIFMYGEDTDYCIRAARAGFKVGWTDRAKVMHIGGASSTSPNFKQWIGEFRGLLYLYKKYHGWMGRLVLQILVFIFIVVRIIAFSVVGKFKYSQTYAKILFNF